jgi:N-acetylmuramoyl-L-alanine amidase
MRRVLLSLVILVASAGPAAGRALVVIDPGHGGSNTGAAGVVAGLYEKRLTLVLAHAVARRLQAGGVKVLLTREDDRFVSLRERVRQANAAGAAIFVSIHANASPTRAHRGYETYILTPEALGIDSVAIRGDDGPPRPELDAETARLLDDLEREASMPAAARLAGRIQERLAEVRGAASSRGIRQAAMDVLMGPTMPAVLVEVGFIDHAVEGVELMRSETREGIAAALAQAILDSLELR